MMLNQTEIKKIAVFRALQLGDMLNVIPAMRALRYAYPHAEITLLGLPWAAAFTKRFADYFNRFIQFPGYPGLPEQVYNEEKFKEFSAQIKGEGFDLLLQLQGNGTIVNQMLLQLGAKYVAGFCTKDSYVHTPLFMEYPNHGSEIIRHLSLMQQLGISLQGDYLEYPVTQQDLDDYASLALTLHPRQYVCIHPGSRGAWRQWPPEYFAGLGNSCAKAGYTIVVTGTQEEEVITSRVVSLLRFPAINVTGKTSMGAIAVLIKNAFVLIANCTGVSHIAAATQTPSIIISMDGEPERWAPLNKQLHYVIDWTTNPDFDKVLMQTNALLAHITQPT